MAGGAQRGGHARARRTPRTTRDRRRRRRPTARTARGRHFTFGPGELLRVADAAQVLGRRHHRADGDRPGPRAATDLVDPAHDLVAVAPEPPLQPQGRERRADAAGRAVVVGGSGTVGTLPTGRASPVDAYRAAMPEPLRLRRLAPGRPACDRPRPGGRVLPGRARSHVRREASTRPASRSSTSATSGCCSRTAPTRRSSTARSTTSMPRTPRCTRGAWSSSASRTRLPRRRRPVRRRRRGRVDGVLPGPRRQHARAARTPPAPPDNEPASTDVV